MKQQKTNNWQIKKLGEVCKYNKGKKPKKLVSEKQDNIAIPYINIKAFEKGIFDEYTDGEKCNLCEDGDLLMVWDGARAGFSGKAKKGAVGSTLMKIEPLEEIVEKNFIYYFLQSIYKKLNTNPRGVGIPHVEPTLLWEAELIIPPLETQHAIVSKIEELFSELDKGIAELKTAQQQLKTYRQSVLKSAFEGKNKLPIAELFNFIGGGTPSKKITNYWNGNIPWASVKDVKGDFLNDTIDRISLEGLKNSSANIAEKNDVILITRISPGKTIISNIKTAINQDLKVVKPKFKTTPKFIFYVFKAIEKECIEKSSGTTVLGINLVNLKEIKVPNLNIEEQHQIVQEIESRLSVADKMEQSIQESLQKAEALRQSILKKAFSGELV